MELFLVIHSGLFVRQKSFLRISVIIKLFPQLLLYRYVESEMPRIPFITPSSNTAVDVGRRYAKQTNIHTKVYYGCSYSGRAYFRLIYVFVEVRGAN